MSELHKDPWEKEYLRKAEKFEAICQKRDSKGFEHDLEGSARVTEYAIRFLRNVTLHAKILLVFFVIIVLVDHYSAEHSDIILKLDGGTFERIQPVQVK